MLFAGTPISSSSSVVLLLSFVFKHKLTREAFSDLLALVEAHCPRPNNCKTTVKKLFEFISQAKGKIINIFLLIYQDTNGQIFRINKNGNICVWTKKKLTTLCKS